MTCEEQNISGGLGTAVAEALLECSGKAKLLRLGIEGSYCADVGSQNYLRREYGLGGDQIAERIRKALAK